MADTISQYNGGNRRAPSLHAPSADGFAAAGAATRRYIENLDYFMRAGNKLALTYYEAIEKREQRDANTYCNKLFRDRRIEILNNVKGKDTDGLLDREDKWQQDEYEKFVKEFKIETEAGRQMWQRHANDYLNRTGSYMLEQQAAYDEQSRLAASDSEIDKLVDTKVGDISALHVAFANNEELFKDKPMKAEQQNDKAITTLVGAWARQNPRAAVAWWKQNKDGLRKEWGQKWSSAADMIDRAERKLQAEAQHAEVMAARAQRLKEKADREYSEKQLNNFVTLAMRGEIDSATFYSLTDDARVSASNKLTAFNLVKGMEDAEKKAQKDEKSAADEVAKAEVVRQMALHGFEDERTQTALTQAMVDGNITSSEASSIMVLGEKLQKVPETAKTFVSQAYEAMDKLYGGFEGAMDTKNPIYLEQAANMKSAIARRVAESPKTAMQDLDMNNPDSWLRRMMASNPPATANPIFSRADWKQGQVYVTPFGSPDLNQKVTSKPVNTGVSEQPKNDAPKGNTILEKLRQKGIKAAN